MFKKTRLAVLGLVVVNSAFAGTMGPVCSPGNVTVPCVAQHWEFGAQALYLSQAFSASEAYGAPDGSWPNQAIYSQNKHAWDWGLRLEGAYKFNTGNDFTATWVHYKNDSKQPINTPIALTSPAFFMVGFPFISVAQNRFDQVNAVMGQYVDLSLVKKLRFYAGMQYAHIQGDASDYTPELRTLKITELNFSQFANSDYKGVGPTAGIDYAYRLNNVFSLTANAAGSILYGTSIYNSGIVYTVPNVLVGSSYAKKRSIVPSLEAKLGVNFAYKVNQGQWNVQAGYQVMNYFNVIQTQGILTNIGPVLSSDYGIFGPYFGFNYVGDV